MVPRLTRRILVAWAAGILSLAAQAPIPLKATDHEAWLGPGQIVFAPSEPSHARGPAVIEGAGFPSQGRRLPWPPRKAQRTADSLSLGLGLHLAGGEIHYLHETIRTLPMEAGQKKPRRVSLVETFKFDVPSWTWESEPSGRLNLEKGCSLVMLAPDCLLGIALSADTFHADNRSYPFAIFRRQPSGLFKLDHFEDAGLEKPAFKADGTWTYPWMASLWIKKKEAFARDHVLLGTGFGLFWVFDEKGSLRRVSRLYPDLTEERLLSGELWEEAVLGLQPMPDGEFLISALDDQALRRGYLIWAQSPPSTTGKGFLDRRNQILDHLLSNTPRIDWYVVNPLDGKVREEIPPRGLPEAVRDARALLDFNWRFKPDGNLRTYSEQERLKADPDAPKGLMDLVAKKAPPQPAPAR